MPAPARPSPGESASLKPTARFGLSELILRVADVSRSVAFYRDVVPREKARLESLGVEVEGPITFESWRAESIYFSDPDAHRVELCGFKSFDPPERKP